MVNARLKSQNLGYSPTGERAFLHHQPCAIVKCSVVKGVEQSDPLRSSLCACWPPRLEEERKFLGMLKPTRLVESECCW